MTGSPYVIEAPKGVHPEGAWYAELQNNRLMPGHGQLAKKDMIEIPGFINSVLEFESFSDLPDGLPLGLAPSGSFYHIVGYPFYLPKSQTVTSLFEECTMFEIYPDTTRISSKWKIDDSVPGAYPAWRKVSQKVDFQSKPGHEYRFIDLSFHHPTRRVGQDRLNLILAGHHSIQEKGLGRPRIAIPAGLYRSFDLLDSIRKVHQDDSERYKINPKGLDFHVINFENRPKDAETVCLYCHAARRHWFTNCPITPMDYDGRYKHLDFIDGVFDFKPEVRTEIDHYMTHPPPPPVIGSPEPINPYVFPF